jgi:RNA polymerase sigma factor (sigma-70 family)
MRSCGRIARSTVTTRRNRSPRGWSESRAITVSICCGGGVTANCRFGDEAAELAAAESESTEGIDALVISERGGRVRAAIAALPEKYRLPILLAYYDDASYDEIAEALGLSRNHVGVLLLRGKQALRKTLAPSEEESR